MSLAAGLLRHRILIEQYVSVVDSNGDPIQDPETGETTRHWTEFATTWAAIQPLSAREFIAAQATQSKVSARIIMRHRPGFDPAMRFVHMLRDNVRGTVYNPAGFLPDQESGLEYVTIPVSTGISLTGQ